MADEKHKNFPWWVLTTAAGVAATAFVFMTFFMPYKSQKIEQLQERLSTLTRELSETQRDKVSLREKTHSLQNRVDALTNSMEKAAKAPKQDCIDIQRKNTELNQDLSRVRTSHQQAAQELSSAREQIRELTRVNSDTQAQLKNCQNNLAAVRKNTFAGKVSTPASPTNSYSKYGYTISPKGCKYAFDGLNCTICIENISNETKRISLFTDKRDNYMLDQQGNQYSITTIKAGGEKGRYLRKTLPPHTPVNFTFTSENFSKASSAASLVFHLLPERKTFSMKKIPIYKNN